MATLVLQLPINEQKEGKRRIMIAYNESYRKNMTLQLIMQAPFRTKIKFTLSLISQNSFYDNQTYIPQYIKMV